MYAKVKTWLALWASTTATLALSGAIGCSNSAATPDAAESDGESDSVVSGSTGNEIDRMCEEILRSPDAVPADQWLKRYPMSSIGEDEDGNPLLLSPLVARLQDAGAEEVAIESAKFGGGEFLVSMIAELPTDAEARRRLFAIEPELSALCAQTPAADTGQQYLHYSFD